jgi:hypothetical protein
MRGVPGKRSLEWCVEVDRCTNMQLHARRSSDQKIILTANEGLCHGGNIALKSTEENHMQRVACG